MIAASNSSDDATPAQSPPQQPVPSATATSLQVPGTLVDIAVESGGFTTLVAALTVAGLVDRLAGDVRFTVFAPNDDAFAVLPAGTFEGVLADITDLNEVLNYQVVSGKVLAADVVMLHSAPILQDSDVLVRL